jgi:hypothetical protein
MPMIDVYGAVGTFADKHTLAAEARPHTDDDRAGARHPDVPEEHRCVCPRVAERLDLERRRGQYLCPGICPHQRRRYRAVGDAPRDESASAGDGYCWERAACSIATSSRRTLSAASCGARNPIRNASRWPPPRSAMTSKP